jgi:hypothetical protein
MTQFAAVNAADVSPYYVPNVIAWVQDEAKHRGVSSVKSADGKSISEWAKWAIAEVKAEMNFLYAVPEAFRVHGTKSVAEIKMDYINLYIDNIKKFQ